MRLAVHCFLLGTSLFSTSIAKADTMSPISDCELIVNAYLNTLYQSFGGAEIQKLSKDPACTTSFLQDMKLGIENILPLYSDGQILKGPASSVSLIGPRTKMNLSDHDSNRILADDLSRALLARGIHIKATDNDAINIAIKARDSYLRSSFVRDVQDRNRTGRTFFLYTGVADSSVLSDGHSFRFKHQEVKDHFLMSHSNGYIFILGKDDRRTPKLLKPLIKVMKNSSARKQPIVILDADGVWDSVNNSQESNSADASISKEDQKMITVVQFHDEALKILLTDPSAI